MNRILMMSLISSFLLILTGCQDDKDKSQHSHDSNANSSSTSSSTTTQAPTTVITTTSNTDDKKDDKKEDEGVTDNQSTEDNTNDTNTDENTSDNNQTNTDPQDLVVCEADPQPIKKFVRIQSTYGLLDAVPFYGTESGGPLALEITEPASAGSSVISVTSTTGLVNDQLVTYYGTNDRYSVGQVSSLTSTQITLKEPLLYDLAANDASLWNFYDDAAHPNEFGLKALADFGFAYAFDVIEPNKVHALVGDSWFKRFGVTPLEDRLLERLPFGSVIQNEGIGGHSLCGLLGRIDNIIDTYNPDYVWINSSINDYFDGVTQEEYKDRMQTLIARVQASDATAIVYDPAPGLLNQTTEDGLSFTMLAHRYAVQILELLRDASE